METVPRLLTPKTTYTFDYPTALEFEKEQLDVFWLPSEITVEKDVQDLLVVMDEASKHGTLTALKLFTKYELFIGEEYWQNKVGVWFQRPEIIRMAALFACIELNVHAPFYNQINEALNLNTDEFFNSYAKDPALRQRMSFIEKHVASDDKLLSLAVFSMLEGAVLYSSFAFLKHFQSNGKNLIKNIVSGINFSVRDENLHSLAGAWLFRVLKDEYQMSDASVEVLNDQIRASALEILEHETRIIEMMYEKGDIPGFPKQDLINFVKSRINLCLENLDIHPFLEVESNPIAEWFYKNINMKQFHDFFAGVGNAYNRNWNESAFTW